MPEPERRLAAVMFADMVGHQEALQQDESLAKHLVDKQRSVIRKASSGRGGRYFGEELAAAEGTGLKGWLSGGTVKIREMKLQSSESVVLFESALDATRCAVEIQRVVREYNREAPSNKDIYVRIGIHVGDVTERDGEVTGEAVAIASRVAPLAEPGGICVSEKVYNTVRDEYELPIIRLGKQDLKNLELPIEVYRLTLPWEKRGALERASLDPHRLAILPLVNMISDPNDEYFADGMTEELISTVSSITGLTLIARTSVKGYKGTTKKVEEIGRELSVGTVLEGSVRKAGNRLRITVQLIDVQSQGHLWAQSYDREFDDVFAIQSDIARQVADALRVRMLPNEIRQVEKRPTNSTGAYTLYLKGRHYWNERTRDDVDKAVKYFEEAVKLDPSFALAYAALADCYLIYENYGWRMPREALQRAKESSLKAIELDPRLAEPHASLGLFYALYEFNWHDAEGELKRAIELKASYTTAYQWYSLVLWFMGRFSESYEQIKRASALDPLSKVIGLNLGLVLLATGRVKDAIEQYGKIIEANPDYSNAHLKLGWCYYLVSRMDEAIDELRKSVASSGDDPYYTAELACMLGFAGRRDEANELIGELEELSKTSHVDNAKIAFALFGAGRTDEAFSYLEKGYEERSDVILYFRAYPWFKEGREDQRWTSFEKRLGLPKS